MDEYKGNGASKLKNALCWFAAYVRYNCLREAGGGLDAGGDSSQDGEDSEGVEVQDSSQDEDEEMEESADRPTEVRLLSRSTPCTCTQPSADTRCFVVAARGLLAPAVCESRGVRLHWRVSFAELHTLAGSNLQS